MSKCYKPEPVNFLDPIACIYFSIEAFKYKQSKLAKQS